MSIYDDEPATPEEIFEVMAVIQTLYGVSKIFVEIVTQRILEKRFTKNQLKDAVNKVIDTYQYPTLIPAAILGYDKRVEVKTYKQMLDLDKEEWEQWERVADNVYRKKI